MIETGPRKRARFATRSLLEAFELHVGGAASSTVNKRIMVLRGKTTFVRLRWSPGRAKLARLLISAGVLVRAAAGAGWRDVWRQRATWLNGWAAASTPIR